MSRWDCEDCGYTTDDDADAEEHCRETDHSIEETETDEES